MRDQNLGDELDSWIIASSEHAHLSWKITVEYLRLQPFISGHQWWVFYDWVPLNNGLVNFEFEPKGNALAASRIGNFIAPVVVMLGNGTLWHPSATGDSGEFGYRSGETIEPELLVSNYAPTVLSNCNLRWMVHAANRTLVHNGSLSATSVAQGTVKSLGAATFAVPRVTKPERFSLEVSFRCDKTTLPTVRTNDWHAWVYPPQPPPVTGEVPVFASTPLFEQLSRLKTIPNLKLIPNGTLPAKAVYLVQQSQLNAPTLVEAVKRGATALMIAWDHHNVPSNSSLMPNLQPRNVIYHNPTWMQVAETPAAVHIGKAAPPALLAMGAPSGWADSSFFESFGPKKGVRSQAIKTIYDRTFFSEIDCL
jgi:hypothetical protein